MTSSKNPSVLLVDDQPEERKALADAMARDGFDVRCADDVDHAQSNRSDPVDVIVSTLGRNGNSSGVRFVRAWQNSHPNVPVVAIVSDGQAGSALQAMRMGVADCVSQPIDPERLNRSLRKVLSIRLGKGTVKMNGSTPTENHVFHGMVGKGKTMRDVFDRATHAAPTDSTVLITGATGTGKDLLAKAVHQMSNRSEHPYMAINVAAVPTTLIESELFGHEKGAFTDAASQRIGRFEAADGGTLFIDEIGDLKLQSQAKLLRVLETRVINRVGSNTDIPIDVRVVAATSCNLERMVAAGTFREDLYYRLNVVRIELPELRERPEDIPVLVDRFLQELAAHQARERYEMTPALREKLKSLPWPGNVRQLKNCLESMLIMAGDRPLDVEDLPPTISSPPRMEGLIDLPLTGYRLDQLEHEAIRQTLDQHKGNRTRCAKALGISVRTLQRKLKRFGGELEPETRDTQNGRPV
jgi:DNA-binding NtrC family response regulator